MRKGLLIQFVLVSLALVCCIVLNMMLLSLAVENHDINYSHVVFSTAFFFSGLMCQRIIYTLIQQYHDEEEDAYAHQ